jgi:UDP-N-acetylmuramyl pentapeptide synthase
MKALARRIIAGRLEKEVKHLIAEKHPIVIAVTGSVGKTTTKLAIA